MEFLNRLKSLDVELKEQTDASTKASILRTLYCHVSEAPFSRKDSKLQAGMASAADKYLKEYEDIVDKMDGTGLNNFAEGAIALCSHHKNESRKWTSSLNTESVLEMCNLIDECVIDKEAKQQSQMVNIRGPEENLEKFLTKEKSSRPQEKNMSAEDVLEIRKKLDDFVKTGVSGRSTVIGLLTTLAHTNMTLQILQKTQIGQTVNKLRKANSDDKVASLTRVLLIKWKTQLPNSKVKDLTNKGNIKSIDEVSEIVKKLDSCMKSGSCEQSIATDLLHSLRSTKMTFEILKNTSIVQTVNTLRKGSSNDRVRSLARKLLTKWRKLLSHWKTRCTKNKLAEMNIKTAKEVFQIAKRLETIVKKGPSEHRAAVGLLIALRSKKIILRILQKSRLFQTVNKLRKASENDKVRSLARSLLTKWKKLLLDSKSRHTSKKGNTSSHQEANIMSIKEISVISKKLDKFIKSGDYSISSEHSTAIELLKTLRNTKITFEILQKTSILQTLNTLRKSSSSSDRVGTLARILLINWRKLLPISKNDISKSIEGNTGNTVDTSNLETDIMSVEEVSEISKKLGNFIKSGASEHSIAIDLLTSLRDTRMTLEILQETSILQTVNTLRKANHDDTVVSLAGALLMKWKVFLPDLQKASDRRPIHKRKHISVGESVLRICMKIDKLVKSDNVEHNTAIGLLKILGNMTMTLEILHKTNIGQSVCDLKEKLSKNDDIVSLALSLLESWKGLLPEGYLSSRKQASIKKLLKIGKTLDDFVKSGSFELTTAIGLIKELSREDMTTPVLQKTNIGQKVWDFMTKENNDKITSLALPMLQYWKTLLPAGKINNESNSKLLEKSKSQAQERPLARQVVNGQKATHGNQLHQQQKSAGNTTKSQISNKNSNNDLFPPYHNIPVKSGTSQTSNSRYSIVQGSNSGDAIIGRRGSLGHSSNGQASSFETQTGPAQIDQAPFFQAPFVQARVGQAPFSQARMGQAPIGQSPIGQAPFGQASHGQHSHGYQPQNSRLFSSTSGSSPFNPNSNFKKQQQLQPPVKKITVEADTVGGPYANFGQKRKNPEYQAWKKGGWKPRLPSDDDDDEPPQQQPGPFRTAADQFLINQQKKNPGASLSNGSSVMGNSYGAAKKSLGTRRGPASKFVPPVLDKEGDENSGSDRLGNDLVNRIGRSVFKGQGSSDGGQAANPENCEDERLRGIDPKMIELIKNEIMDNGTPITWDDIAGLDFAKKTIKEIVVWPMLRPDIFTGLRGPPKGLLLFGPPGTGKTLIGKCIASQSKSTFFCISASSLTSKWVGEGEKMVKALFAVARVNQPSVVFIDEIDSLLSQRSDSEHESSRRIKTEFLVQLDGAGTGSEDRILVIGATNRPQEIDEAARRRFVKRLLIPLPEAVARRQIVVNLLAQQNSDVSEADVQAIGERTEGYSGADMTNLCREAALGPIRSIPLDQIETITSEQVRPISYQDFESALLQVRASVSSKDLQLYADWNQTYGSFGM